MNEYERKFVMDTIRKMVGNVPEWQVRKLALEWYSKGVLTEEDLKEIDEMYKPTTTEDVTVENNEPISEENSEPVVAENETIETEEEGE